MCATSGPDRGRRLLRSVESRLFDESTPHLDRFGPLLGLTALTVVCMMLIDVTGADDVTTSITSLILSLVIGITLLLAIRAAGMARGARVAVTVFVGFASVFSLVLLIVKVVSDADVSGFEADRPSPIWVLIAVVTPVAVIRRLVHHRTVTGETMMGAVAAYLLIAVAFAYLFLYISAGDTAEFFLDGANEPPTAYMYFSLVTMTTVGYGDLAPASSVGRLLSTSEAVIGQVYLVTFVAMFVGLLIQQREDPTVDGGGA